MKTQPNKHPRVNVITLGCSKNTYDSEVLMGQLHHNGLDVVHEQKARKTDTVIINTCGFIDRSKQESIDTILEYAEAKEKGKINKLIVMGCLSERYLDELQLEIPQVDAYFGTKNIPKVLKFVGADYKHELLGERQLTTPSHYAFFKIAEGCDRPCAFCAIPLMRGKHESFDMDSLIQQARQLAKNGVKELILIAQELTYYGKDLYGKKVLADLLNKLCEVEGIEWIRLQYAYPAQFPMEILDVIKNQPKICNYLDMPLQHSSTNMLKIMRRGITRKETEKLLHTIRETNPDIAIRTTFLVGHPGETEQDVLDLIEFIQEQQFDRVGVFTYSHEENTHAGTLNDEISDEEKQNRSDAVMEAQRDISLLKNQQKIGKTFKVMIDRVEGEYFVGRTEHDSPEVDNEVLISTKDNYVRIGDFSNIIITDALEYDLYGKVV
jgi:ribosomal protein S12 methylthiotransferase